MLEEINEKIQKLNKYYKKNHAYNIIEIRFINYLKTNLYIRIDFYSKDFLYKLTWLDLNCGDKNTIIKFINTEVMNRESVEYIIRILETNIFMSKKISKDKKNDIVYIKSNISNIIPGMNEIMFYRYLPKELNFMVDVLVIISKNLPSKLDEYFVQILAIITGEQYKYDYLNTIKFNLKKDNINNIFDPFIIERAKAIKEDNILFLEKFDNIYYAVYKNDIEYVIFIKEDEKNKVLLHCSCGCEYYCEHIYKVLEQINDKIEKKFYKVVYNEPNNDLLEKMTNNEYILCIGILNNCLKLINNNSQIGLLPLVDENGNCNWKILEDNNDILFNEINKYVDNNVDQE